MPVNRCQALGIHDIRQKFTAQFIYFAHEALAFVLDWNYSAFFLQYIVYAPRQKSIQIIRPIQKTI